MATQKFKRMRAFARFRNKIWCMDIAYVDKLAQKNNGVKFLLVCQDLFDRTVNAKGMKTKDSKETVKAYSSMITKTNRSKKIWVDKGTNFAGAFEKFCAAEEYKFTLLWVRLRRLLLNVQNDHWKIIFTVTWRILDTSIYTIYINLSLPWTLEETVR